MLWTASRLIGYSIRATDGEIGAVDDLYVDDQSWTVRWAVIDTGTWLPGRRVLLPSSELKRPSAPDRDFHVNLTRPQIKGSPEADTDGLVSRQHEERLYGYYGWPPYWAAMPMGGLAPPLGPAGAAPGGAALEREGGGEPHLRSVQEVSGYDVHARDGDIGHVADFLLDTDTWDLRYIVVDTSNWLLGKTVLIAPRWLVGIDAADRAVRLDRTRDAVENSPEYDPSATVDRAYEARLHGHYGYPVYWE